MSHRIEKVNHLLRRELSDLIQHQLKDPRLSTFISVTEVSTSPDMKYAKVFVSSINGKEDEAKVLGVLTAAAGFLRRELAGILRMRSIPELSFHWDNSIEHGDKVLRLLDQVAEEDD